MGEALYRKYRSKSLSEIVGQEHITDTLKNAIKSKRISHAYLFTGPRGVGKTSIARILAYQLNDIPYELESSKQMDIIEIDGASNRRIDEIRELRDKVHVAPTSGTYKVYIIDEVHMLTKEAFNALLKTLEEPPKHVIFILATTEAHKLPETIISRTQRYTFKPVPQEKVVKHLQTIAKSEKITISDSALELIAAHGEGSFRDSISLLDQVSSIANSVDENHVRSIIGVPPQSEVEEITAAVFEANLQKLHEHLSQLYLQGYQSQYIAKEIGNLLHRQILSKSLPDNQTGAALQLMQKLINTASSPDPKSYLQIILFDAVFQLNPPASPKQQPTSEQTQSQTMQPVKEAPSENNDETAAEVESKPLSDVKPAKPTKSDKKSDAPKVTSSNETLWNDVLNELKGTHNTLYGIARMGTASVNDKQVTLAFKFAFHQRRCNETRNKQKIIAIIHELTDEPYELECIVDSKLQSTPTSATTNTSSKPAKPKSDTLESITNVFGGGEILE